MWGVWEKLHWVPHSAMWKTDFTPTRQVDACREPVFGRWWTDDEITANGNGEVRARAFYGGYRITVDGMSKSVKLEKQHGRAEATF